MSAVGDRGQELHRVHLKLTILLNEVTWFSEHPEGDWYYRYPFEQFNEELSHIIFLLQRLY